MVKSYIQKKLLEYLNTYIEESDHHEFDVGLLSGSLKLHNIVFRKTTAMRNIFFQHGLEIVQARAASAKFNFNAKHILTNLINIQAAEIEIIVKPICLNIDMMHDYYLCRRMAEIEKFLTKESGFSGLIMRLLENFVLEIENLRVVLDTSELHVQLLYRNTISNDAAYEATESTPSEEIKSSELSSGSFSNANYSTENQVGESQISNIYNRSEKTNSIILSIETISIKNDLEVQQLAKTLNIREVSIKHGAIDVMNLPEVICTLSRNDLQNLKAIVQVSNVEFCLERNLLMLLFPIIHSYFSAVSFQNTVMALKRKITHKKSFFTFLSDGNFRNLLSFILKNPEIRNMLLIDDKSTKILLGGNVACSKEKSENIENVSYFVKQSQTATKHAMNDTEDPTSSLMEAENGKETCSLESQKDRDAHNRVFSRINDVENQINVECDRTSTVKSDSLAFKDNQTYIQPYPISQKSFQEKLFNCKFWNICDKHRIKVILAKLEKINKYRSLFEKVSTNSQTSEELDIFLSIEEDLSINEIEYHRKMSLRIKHFRPRRKYLFFTTTLTQEEKNKILRELDYEEPSKVQNLEIVTELAFGSVNMLGFLNNIAISTYNSSLKTNLKEFYFFQQRICVTSEDVVILDTRSSDHVLELNRSQQKMTLKLGELRFYDLQYLISILGEFCNLAQNALEGLGFVPFRTCYCEDLNDYKRSMRHQKKLHKVASEPFFTSKNSKKSIEGMHKTLSYDLHSNFRSRKQSSPELDDEINRKNTLLSNHNSINQYHPDVSAEASKTTGSYLSDITRPVRMQKKPSYLRKYPILYHTCKFCSEITSQASNINVNMILSKWSIQILDFSFGAKHTEIVGDMSHLFMKINDFDAYIVKYIQDCILKHGSEESEQFDKNRNAYLHDKNKTKEESGIIGQQYKLRYKDQDVVYNKKFACSQPIDDIKCTEKQCYPDLDFSASKQRTKGALITSESPSTRASRSKTIIVHKNSIAVEFKNIETTSIIDISTESLKIDLPEFITHENSPLLAATLFAVFSEFRKLCNLYDFYHRERLDIGHIHSDIPKKSNAVNLHSLGNLQSNLDYSEDSEIIDRSKHENFVDIGKEHITEVVSQSFYESNCEKTFTVDENRHVVHTRSIDDSFVSFKADLISLKTLDCRMCKFDYVCRRHFHSLSCDSILYKNVSLQNPSMRYSDSIIDIFNPIFDINLFEIDYDAIQTEIYGFIAILHDFSDKMLRLKSNLLVNINESAQVLLRNFESGQSTDLNKPICVHDQEKKDKADDLQLEALRHSAPIDSKYKIHFHNTKILAQYLHVKIHATIKELYTDASTFYLKGFEGIHENYYLYCTSVLYKPGILDILGVVLQTDSNILQVCSDAMTYFLLKNILPLNEGQRTFEFKLNIFGPIWFCQNITNINPLVLKAEQISIDMPLDAINIHMKPMISSIDLMHGLDQYLVFKKFVVEERKHAEAEPNCNRSKNFLLGTFKFINNNSFYDAFSDIIDESTKKLDRNKNHISCCFKEIQTFIKCFSEKRSEFLTNFLKKINDKIFLIPDHNKNVDNDALNSQKNRKGGFCGVDQTNLMVLYSEIKVQKTIDNLFLYTYLQGKICGETYKSTIHCTLMIIDVVSTILSGFFTSEIRNTILRGLVDIDIDLFNAFQSTFLGKIHCSDAQIVGNLGLIYSAADSFQDGATRKFFYNAPPGESFLQKNELAMILSNIDLLFNYCKDHDSHKKNFEFVIKDDLRCILKEADRSQIKIENGQKSCGSKENNFLAKNAHSNDFLEKTNRFEIEHSKFSDKCFNESYASSLNANLTVKSSKIPNSKSIRTRDLRSCSFSLISNELLYSFLNSNKQNNNAFLTSSTLMFKNFWIFANNVFLIDENDTLLIACQELDVFINKTFFGLFCDVYIQKIASCLRIRDILLLKNEFLTPDFSFGIPSAPSELKVECTIAKIYHENLQLSDFLLGDSLFVVLSRLELIQNNELTNYQLLKIAFEHNVAAYSQQLYSENEIFSNSEIDTSKKKNTPIYETEYRSSEFMNYIIKGNAECEDEQKINHSNLNGGFYSFGVKQKKSRRNLIVKAPHINISFDSTPNFNIIKCVVKGGSFRDAEDLFFLKSMFDNFINEKNSSAERTILRDIRETFLLLELSEISFDFKTGYNISLPSVNLTNVPVNRLYNCNVPINPNYHLSDNIKDPLRNIYVKNKKIKATHFGLQPNALMRSLDISFQSLSLNHCGYIYENSLHSFPRYSRTNNQPKNQPRLCFNENLNDEMQSYDAGSPVYSYFDKQNDGKFEMYFDNAEPLKSKRRQAEILNTYKHNRSEYNLENTLKLKDIGKTSKKSSLEYIYNENITNCQENPKKIFSSAISEDQKTLDYAYNDTSLSWLGSGMCGIGKYTKNILEPANFTLKIDQNDLFLEFTDKSRLVLLPEIFQSTNMQKVFFDNCSYHDLAIEYGQTMIRNQTFFYIDFNTSNLTFCDITSNQRSDIVFNADEDETLVRIGNNVLRVKIARRVEYLHIEVQNNIIFHNLNDFDLDIVLSTSNKSIGFLRLKNNDLLSIDRDVDNDKLVKLFNRKKVMPKCCDTVKSSDEIVLDVDFSNRQPFSNVLGPHNKTQLSHVRSCFNDSLHNNLNHYNILNKKSRDLTVCETEYVVRENNKVGSKYTEEAERDRLDQTNEPSESTTEQRYRSTCEFYSTMLPKNHTHRDYERHDTSDCGLFMALAIDEVVSDSNRMLFFDTSDAFEPSGDIIKKINEGFFSFDNSSAIVFAEIVVAHRRDMRIYHVILQPSFFITNCLPYHVQIDILEKSRESVFREDAVSSLKIDSLHCSGIGSNHGDCLNPDFHFFADAFHQREDDTKNNVETADLYAKNDSEIEDFEHKGQKGALNNLTKPISFSINPNIRRDAVKHSAEDELFNPQNTSLIWDSQFMSFGVNTKENCGKMIKSAIDPNKTQNRCGNPLNSCKTCPKHQNHASGFKINSISPCHKYIFRLFGCKSFDIDLKDRESIIQNFNSDCKDASNAGFEERQACGQHSKYTEILIFNHTYRTNLIELHFYPIFVIKNETNHILSVSDQDFEPGITFKNILEPKCHLEIKKMGYSSLKKVKFHTFECMDYIKMKKKDRTQEKALDKTPFSRFIKTDYSINHREYFSKIDVSSLIFYDETLLFLRYCFFRIILETRLQDFKFNSLQGLDTDRDFINKSNARENSIENEGDQVHADEIESPSSQRLFSTQKCYEVCKQINYEAISEFTENFFKNNQCEILSDRIYLSDSEKKENRKGNLFSMINDDYAARIENVLPGKILDYLKDFKIVFSDFLASWQRLKSQANQEMLVVKQVNPKYFTLSFETKLGEGRYENTRMLTFKDAHVIKNSTNFSFVIFAEEQMVLLAPNEKKPIQFDLQIQNMEILFCDRFGLEEQVDISAFCDKIMAKSDDKAEVFEESTNPQKNTCFCVIQNAPIPTLQLDQQQKNLQNHEKNLLFDFTKNCSCSSEWNRYDANQLSEFVDSLDLVSEFKHDAIFDWYSCSDSNKYSYIEYSNKLYRIKESLVSNPLSCASIIIKNICGVAFCLMREKPVLFEIRINFDSQQKNFEIIQSDRWIYKIQNTTKYPCQITYKPLELNFEIPANDCLEFCPAHASKSPVWFTCCGQTWKQNLHWEDEGSVSEYFQSHWSEVFQGLFNFEKKASNAPTNNPCEDDKVLKTSFSWDNNSSRSKFCAANQLFEGNEPSKETFVENSNAVKPLTNTQTSFPNLDTVVQDAPAVPRELYARTNSQELENFLRRKGCSSSTIYSKNEELYSPETFVKPRHFASASYKSRKIRSKEVISQSEQNLIIIFEKGDETHLKYLETCSNDVSAITLQIKMPEMSLAFCDSAEIATLHLKECLIKLVRNMSGQSELYKIFCGVKRLQLDDQSLNPAYPVIMYPKKLIYSANIESDVSENFFIKFGLEITKNDIFNTKPFTTSKSNFFYHIMNNIDNSTLGNVAVKKDLCLVDLSNSEVKNQYRIDVINLDVKSFYLHIDENLIYKILNVFQPTTTNLIPFHCARCLKPVCTCLSYQATPSFKLLIDTLVFSNIKMNVTFKPRRDKKDYKSILLRYLVENISDLQLNLPSIYFVRLFASPQDILAVLQAKYKSVVFEHFGPLLGSIDMIGNISSLTESVAVGTSELIHHTSDGIRNLDPLAFTTGFSKGLQSFGKNTLSGITSCISKAAASIGQNVSHATFDKEFQASRKLFKNEYRPDKYLFTKKELLRTSHKNKPFAWGAKRFVKSCFSGVKGLVVKPIEATREGSVEVMKSIGKGVVGMITKPIVGAADLTTGISDGISQNIHETQVFRLEYPRYDCKKSFDENLNRCFYIYNTIINKEDESFESGFTTANANIILTNKYLYILDVQKIIKCALKNVNVLKSQISCGSKTYQVSSEFSTKVKSVVESNNMTIREKK